MAVIQSPMRRDYVQFALASPHGGWITSEHTFSGEPALNDVVEMFSNELWGWRIDDWKVEMEQIDTGGAPTAAFGIGGLNSSDNGIQAGTGLVWGTGVSLGRTAPPNTSLVRATNSEHRRAWGKGWRVGLHYSSAAQVSAFTGKRVWMSLLLLPV